MQKNFAVRLLIGMATIVVVICNSGCKKESISNKDAVTFPHALFFGTDKGEVWNTNDGVNYRSYFTVDNTIVYDIIKAKEFMFYSNEYVYKFEDPDNGNLVYPGTGGQYYSFFNNMHYSAEEERIYIPISGNTSPVAYSDDYGENWNYYSSQDSFSDGSNHADYGYNIKEIDSVGIYFIGSDEKVYSKPFGREFWTRRNITNLQLNTAGLNQMTSTGDKLVFWNVFTDFVTQDIQVVDPASHAVIKSIAPPSVGIILTIVPRDENYLYLCTSDGLIGLNLTTSIYEIYSGDIDGLTIYDVSIQQTTYRSGNVHTFIYAATSEGLYLSEDDGVSFTKVYDGFITSLSH